MKTLVVIRALQIGECHFKHGEELPPHALPREAIELHIERKHLVEYDASERRSLHRLLHRFSDCSQAERLSSAELAAYALT